MRLCAPLLLIVFSSLALANDAERIRQLEERVQRLEALVQKLSGATPAASVADQLLQDLATTEAPPAAPAARPLRAESPVTQELLPELGKIGAQASFLAGAHNGPYGLGRGNYLGGALVVPLAQVGNGRLQYEFSAGLSRSSRNLPVTSNVAQVANLAALANLNPTGGVTNVAQAITGTGAAPFPVTVNARWNLQLLQVVPFSLRYTTYRFDRARFRPYVAVGPGLYVTITNQFAQPGLRNDAALSPELRGVLNSFFGNTAPFGGALIGGQLTAAPESVARGLPSGQGGMTLGLHTGGGFDFRVHRHLSLGVDLRWNRLASGLGFTTFSTRTNWHF
jgi:hypothetical protein